MDPIDVGATIDVNGTEGRIVNIWIDEDGVPHLTIRWRGIRYEEEPDEKVTYSDLRDMLAAGEAERLNSGHEAWQWRAKRD